MSGNLAMFVDAGYLFKQGALCVFGTSLGRRDTSLDASQFVEHLNDWVRETYPHMEMLRTYWYDGSKDGVPSPEQLEVAALPYVKFRRGRINATGQQKGVDTLIVRDLMVLSQERSIQRAIVLSGDEDLREGIEYAQDRGVHVTVLGIRAKGASSQSRELVREADQILYVPEEIVKRTLSRTTPVAPGHPQGSEIATVKVELDTEISSTQTRSTEPISQAAWRCAVDWLSRASGEEIAALLLGRPLLPSPLDGGLLQVVAKETGIYPLSEAQRREARAAFWEAIDAR